MILRLHITNWPLTEFPLTTNSAATVPNLHLSHGDHASVARQCIEIWRFFQKFLHLRTPNPFQFPLIDDFHQFTRDLAYDYNNLQPKRIHYHFLKQFKQPLSLWHSSPNPKIAIIAISWILTFNFMQFNVPRSN